LEHLSACAGVVFGEGSAPARAWVAEGRQALLNGGGAALAAHVAATRRQGRSPAKYQALDAVARYFAAQAGPLGYAGRLATGLAIGSGMVEGACKHMIGRRMKQTGARWRVRRANRMATMCCSFHSDTWKVYWEQRLN